MNNYDKRWEFALKWGRKAKELFDTGEYMIMHGLEIYNPETSKIIIDEEKRTVALTDVIVMGSKVTKFTQCIFEGDTNWDHGAHTPIEQLKIQFQTFKFFKNVEITV